MIGYDMIHTGFIIEMIAFVISLIIVPTFLEIFISSHQAGNNVFFNTSIITD